MIGSSETLGDSFTNSTVSVVHLDTIHIGTEGSTQELRLVIPPMTPERSEDVISFDDQITDSPVHVVGCDTLYIDTDGKSKKINLVIPPFTTEKSLDDEMLSSNSVDSAINRTRTGLLGTAKQKLLTFFKMDRQQPSTPVVISDGTPVDGEKSIDKNDRLRPLVNHNCKPTVAGPGVLRMFTDVIHDNSSELKFWLLWSLVLLGSRRKW